jgi:hypothetical protein
MAEPRLVVASSRCWCIQDFIFSSTRADSLARRIARSSVDAARSSTRYSVLHPRAHDKRVREIVPGLLEAAIHVAPAPGQSQAVLASRSGDMRRRRVADDRPLVVTDERFESRRRFVVADPVVHESGRREAPHLPRRQRLVLEVRPTRLVEANHRSGPTVG